MYPQWVSWIVIFLYMEDGHFMIIMSCFSLCFEIQFVKTILCQGHLSSLPLYVSPVYWAYDYALRVYPVPDVIVFADKYDPFNITNTDCLCINPVCCLHEENSGFGAV